ncbi:TPA: hypothetical protein L9A94_003249 [Klebsiella pneumoniae]|nr:hypothetical protein [Klebsiella pneumoniae]
MTTYKTGNPLGSAAVKDLFDNAENLDHFENDRSNETWENRFGVPGKTRYGMEQEHDRQISSQEARFQQFLLSSGYVFLGDYEDGPLTITEYNQLIRYQNELWKITADTDIPFTTAGNNSESWEASDKEHFVSVGDGALRQGLGAADGYKLIGQVSYFSELRGITPEYDGQKILLACHTYPGRGGGEFIAVNSSATDDGGCIAVVNDSWHWRRARNGSMTPEMFGASGDLKNDDVTAIGLAVSAAISTGELAVRGDGAYLFTSSYTIPAISKTISGAMFLGIEIYLNTVVADSSSWPDVPEKWWDAKAVFYPASGVEHMRLIVNNFDGGGKATFFHTKNGRMATSLIHVGCMRNYIVGVRNLYDMAGQCTMNDITGHNWQDGYMGVLIGGTGNGNGNAECWTTDINWFANQRYGGISLQDRSQYAKIRAGTYDYNGKWSARLVLSDVVTTGAYTVQFGDILTTSDGKSGYALSNIMNGFGVAEDLAVHITESGNKLDGVSDYTVGSTISNADGSFSAKIKSVQLCSASAVRYFDIIVSNVTGGFSRCDIDTTYGGGIYGSNRFTNREWSPNAVAGTTTGSFMGLQPGGSSSVRYWYERGIFGTTPWLTLAASGVSFGKHVQMESNRLAGVKADYAMEVGVLTTLFVFPPAPDSSHPNLYEVFSVSTATGQGGSALIRVTTGGISILSKTEAFMSYTASGFSLQATLIGSSGILSSTMTKRV